MEQFTIALGVLLTLSVLSIIWRDNPLYKGAEAVIIGFSAGHLMAVFFARAWQLGFVPLGNQFALLFTTPVEGDKVISLILLGGGLLLILCMALLRTNQLINTILSPLAFLSIVAALFMLLPMFIPVLLGILFYSRFVRPVAWMVRLPISFFFGFAGSLSVVMALDASIWRQIAATVQTLFSFSTSYQTLGGMAQVPAINLDGILIVAGTICALVYFFMTREHRGVIGSAAGVGRYFIMIALGAKFGSVCIIHDYQKTFNPGFVEELEPACRSAEIGCVDCKKRLIAALEELLVPMRERRAQYEKPGVLDEILRDGTARAKREAEATMALVRQAMKIDYWERWG